MLTVSEHCVIGAETRSKLWAALYGQRMESGLGLSP